MLRTMVQSYYQINGAPKVSLLLLLYVCQVNTLRFFFPSDLSSLHDLENITKTYVKFYVQNDIYLCD